MWLQIADHRRQGAQERGTQPLATSSKILGAASCFEALQRSRS